MTNTDYTLELETAVNAVRQAAVVCRKVQALITPEVLKKNDKSPVTVADFASQALICKMLEEQFKDDPVIGEEDSSQLRKSENRELLDSLVKRVGSLLPDATADDILSWIDRGGHNSYEDRFWTLDPIDGTKGFLRGDQYAISLALIVKGEIVAGALCCPNLSSGLIDKDADNSKDDGLILYAQKNKGTYKRSTIKNSRSQKVTVSKESKNQNIRVCESVESAHSSHSDSAKIAAKLGITASPVRIDSQAKYATVAMGDAEAYLRLPGDAKYREKIWDHAGGVITVTEAGGRVTDINGAPLDFSKGRTLQNNSGVIVSNKNVHDQIIETIKTLKIGQF